MKFILYLVLFGLARSDPIQLEDNFRKLTINFEIGANFSLSYSVQLGKIMTAVCESKTKELKISVEATSPVEVRLCNCHQKKHNLVDPAAESVSLDQLKFKNLSLIICGNDTKDEELEFSVTGKQGIKGKIVLDVVENKKQSAIELFYKFEITGNDGIYINLTEFEKVSRLAGLYQRSLQMNIEVDGEKNVSLTFMKCGMKALPIDRFIANNQFTFEPGMLRMLDDVTDYACGEYNTPLQVFVGGAANTTGTLTFQILQDPANRSENSDSYVFLIIHLTIFALIVLTVIPMIWWAETRQKSGAKEDEKDIASMWSL